VENAFFYNLYVHFIPANGCCQSIQAFKKGDITVVDLSDFVPTMEKLGVLQKLKA